MAKTNLTIDIPFTAYKGTSQISATITKSNITTRPSNLTDDNITITSSTSSSSGNIQFTLYAGSELGNNSGEITLTFTCNGKQVPMKYGWSKSVQAPPGTNGEDAVLLRIESSRGTVFKNDQISTVLSVVIYKGSHRITDSKQMKAVFGNTAYLQWEWLRIDDESYGIISASDPRFGNDGFTFTLSPDDVDTKVTFECKLIL